MQVFFSTVIRNAPPKKGGEVVWLDWESKNIRRSAPVYAANPEVADPNPRGNTRGGRGIEVMGDRVIVASYHTLRVYDRELRHQHDVSHPLMVNLHEIHSNADNRIWVSATAIDAALEIDISTGTLVREYWPRELPGFREELQLQPLSIDKEADNRTKYLSRRYFSHPSHLHLNAIASWESETYALFHAFGAIANLDAQNVVVQDQELRNGHNLIVRQDGTAVANDTYRQAVRFYDLDTRTLTKVIRLTDFEWVRSLARRHMIAYRLKTQGSRALIRILDGKTSPHSSRIETWWQKTGNMWGEGSPARRLLADLLWPPRPLYVRGLDVVGDFLFVGISPASILCIDHRAGELVDVYQHSQDVGVCIHGLRAVS